MTTITEVNKSLTERILTSVLLWFLVFVLSIYALVAFNIAPPEIKETALFVFERMFKDTKNLQPLGKINLGAGVLPYATSSIGVEPQTSEILVKPNRVFIEKINVDSRIVNPVSTDSATLDASLLEGVVRYPGSGTMLDESKIFLFGHSSFLPTIRNQSYRAFNKLGELNLGDEIRLYSEKSEYIFKVTKVEKVTAEETLVKFEKGSTKKLILSTCDSFGEKSDRFVVEAELLASRPI